MIFFPHIIDRCSKLDDSKSIWYHNSKFHSHFCFCSLLSIHIQINFNSLFHILIVDWINVEFHDDEDLRSQINGFDRNEMKVNIASEVLKGRKLEIGKWKKDWMI
jgi:hypothetical protein